MSEKVTAEQELWTRKVALIKQMAINPNEKIPVAGHEIGVGRSMSYAYMKEFANVYRYAETKYGEEDFIEHVVKYYNKRMPVDIEDDQYLRDVDVIALRPIAYRLVGGDEGSGETLNNAEEANTSTLSQTNVPDLSTNAAILETLLQNTRQVQPANIKKFLHIYGIMEPQWNQNPIELLEYLKYMFGPTAGENIFRAFNAARGAHVYTPPSQSPFGMPMIPGMGMGPSMGNPNDPMYQAMMQKEIYEDMKAEKEKKRQDEQFDKMMRVMMLKMMGSSMNDKMPMNPFDPNNPVPFQVNEVMDETGAKVKQRTITPNWGGQGGNNELMMMILKNSMDQNNMLLNKSMDSGKPITDMLMAMFPHFRANSNPIEMVGQLKQAFPEVFAKEQNGLSNSIEALRLKFDTEMAMQAQKMQLFEKQHTWEMEKLDKQEAGKNAEGWMQMLGQLGEKLAAPVANVVMSQFGSGLAAKQGQQLTPQQQAALAQQQALIQQRMREQQEAQQRAEREENMQYAPTASTSQPTTQDFAMEYLKMQNQQLQQALQAQQQYNQPVQQVAQHTQAAAPVQKELNPETLSQYSLQELESMRNDLEQDINNTNKWSSLIEEQIAAKKLTGESSASLERPETDIFPGNDDEDDDSMSLMDSKETQPVTAAAVKSLEEDAE